MGKNKRNRIVYSTNPDFDFTEEDNENEETLEPGEQLLYVSIDRKQRAGKEVTIIEGFVGLEEDLKSLGKYLKNKCGVGGAVKDGQILLQGKLKDKVYDLLIGEGYSVKQKGGN